MLLVGGLDAWKREFGDSEVDRDLSSVGSSVTVLNGGISRSSSSSSTPYASPPYVRNGSSAESSLPSSFTTRELGALNGGSRLPPSTETSPGPSYTLPQPSEGINGFGSDSKLLSRPVIVNGRPPTSNRPDLVCTPPSRCKLTAEARLGHTELRKWNHFHSIPLISQTRCCIYPLPVSSSPFYPRDPRACVTPNRVH